MTTIDRKYKTLERIHNKYDNDTFIFNLTYIVFSDEFKEDDIDLDRLLELSEDQYHEICNILNNINLENIYVSKVNNKKIFYSPIRNTINSINNILNN